MKTIIIICLWGLTLPCFCLDKTANEIISKKNVENIDSEKKEISKKKYTFLIYESENKSTFNIPHYLGEPCASKWNAFQTNYTRVYDQNIGFSNTSVEFAKPAVYHAVTKINKYVIKSVKKGKMTKEKASKLLYTGLCQHDHIRARHKSIRRRTVLYKGNVSLNKHL